MSNPLFTALGGGKTPSPFGNMQNMMQQFQQFRQNFQGDPRQKVQELLNSGKMSQEQFANLQGMAQQFMSLLK